MNKKIILFCLLTMTPFGSQIEAISYWQAGKNLVSQNKTMTKKKVAFFAVLGIACTVKFCFLCWDLVKHSQNEYKKYKEGESSFSRVKNRIMGVKYKKDTWWDYTINGTIFLVTALISYLFLSSLHLTHEKIRKLQVEGLKENGNDLEVPNVNTKQKSDDGLVDSLGRRGSVEIVLNEKDLEGLSDGSEKVNPSVTTFQLVEQDSPSQEITEQFDEFKELEERIIKEASEDGCELIIYCMKNLSFDIFLKLLDRGKINYENQYSHVKTSYIRAACFYGRVEFLKLFEEKGTKFRNINKKTGDTLLHTACYTGELSVVKYLVEEADLDIDRLNYKGVSPLHVSSIQGYKGLVKYLFSKDAVITEILLDELRTLVSKPRSQNSKYFQHREILKLVNDVRDLRANC